MQVGVTSRSAVCACVHACACASANLEVIGTGEAAKLLGRLGFLTAVLLDLLPPLSQTSR